MALLQMLIAEHGIKFGNITPPIEQQLIYLFLSCVQFYVSYAPFNYISHANNSRFSRFSNAFFFHCQVLFFVESSLTWVGIKKYSISIYLGSSASSSYVLSQGNSYGILQNNTNVLCHLRKWNTHCSVSTRMGWYFARTLRSKHREPTEKGRRGGRISLRKRRRRRGKRNHYRYVQNSSLNHYW